MTKDELSLLKILSINLFRPSGVMPEITPQIRELAKVHAVPAFLSLEPAYIVTNMRVKHAAQELHTILTESDIPYVILKGSASAFYYGKKEMYRSAGDVDRLSG